MLVAATLVSGIAAVYATAVSAKARSSAAATAPR
jgi:hypothetical protein